MAVILAQHQTLQCIAGRFESNDNVWFLSSLEGLFTWSLHPQHIAVSCNILSWLTKQNTDILIDGEQIYASKYKIKMQFMPNTQYLEPILFPESTFRFMRLKFGVLNCNGH